ncbi:MAG TPA: hypothetical protein VHN15_00700 [Thermoanaerobaculia bacterium]|nr:hypothetical protein [Thermoanaerobaculia bacterium]
MKLKLTLLACSCLLLLVPLADAAEPEQMEAPVALFAESETHLIPAETSPDCSELGLALLTPEARDLAAGPCGPCSATGCKGASIGTYCGFNKTCQFPYYQLCTDSTWRCYCWSGPLP